MAANDGYDQVPYPSGPLEQTHPDRLAGLGRLFGLRTAAPAGCRYLELGCGNGSNLLGMASTLPGATFIGIDLAAAPIAQAQRDARDLQLSNLAFSQGDITDLAALADPATLGACDYIVAHGVYSWVPGPVRDALFRLIQRQLAPHGVAYISYNTLPGGHVRQMVRSMMRYHTRAVGAIDERLRQGRELVRFLSTANTGPATYGPLLANELAHLTEADPGLIHHDDFSPINDPCYLHQFLSHAAGHQLQFLSEAVLQEMQLHHLAPEVRQTLLQMDGEVALREQYLDFLKCRRFRQTLLCHQARTLERQAAPLQALDTLLLASDARSDPDAAAPTAARPVSYLRVGRAGLSTSSLAVQVVLAELRAAWPQAIDLAALVLRLRTHPALVQASAETVAPVIWHLAEIGMLDLRVEPLPCAAVVSERPRASPLVRWQLERSRQVTSQAHTLVRLNGELLPVLLPLLDGTRSVPQLVASITDLVASGQLPAPADLDRSDGAAVAAACAQAVAQSLERLRTLALLAP